MRFSASWEGYAIEQVLAAMHPSEAFFWATYSRAELDLMITINGKRYGFEFKYSDAPGASKSMRIAINDLNLEHLWVIYPGKEAYNLDRRLSVLPLSKLSDIRI